MKCVDYYVVGTVYEYITILHYKLTQPIYTHNMYIILRIIVEPRADGYVGCRCGEVERAECKTAAVINENVVRSVLRATVTVTVCLSAACA